MRKPRPTDPLHPIKSDFIRAKHLSQAFVFRPAGSKEDPPSSETELSRQLHGAVRTNNLETSLRLLSQGANPNYFHPEKNNSTALHIACKSGQTGQVELLLVFGSDPGAIDKNGRTPSDYAKYDLFIFLSVIGNYAFTMYVLIRGISIPLGERCAILPSEVSLSSSCSKSHDFLAFFALAHSKINKIA